MTTVQQEFRRAWEEDDQPEGGFPEPEVSIEWITPEQARRYVLVNGKNRRVTKAALRDLRQEIQESGGYKLTPDAIAFNWFDELENGGHRMTLVAAGDEPAQFIVVRNLPPDSWDVTDKGKGRSFADSLGRMGEKNTAVLAAALRTLYRYEQTGEMRYNSGGSRIAEGTLKRFLLDERPEIRTAVNEARNVPLRLPYPVAPSTAAVLFYCFWKGTSWDDAMGFFSLVRTGENLQEGDPILALRRRLNDDLTARANKSYQKRLEEIERRALLIIAFNKWMRGERVRVLAWRPGGARPDRFPVPMGYEPLADFA